MNILRSFLGQGLIAGLLLTALAGCRPTSEAVCVEGSDTMINLAQAWAENYHASRPDAISRSPAAARA